MSFGAKWAFDFLPEYYCPIFMGLSKSNKSKLNVIMSHMCNLRNLKIDELVLDKNSICF
jgi:hypothetical protein